MIHTTLHDTDITVLRSGGKRPRIQRRYDRIDVWGGGAPWAVTTFKGEQLDSKRTVTTKVTLAFDAVFGTDYTRELVAAIAPLGDPDRGWPEGVYEVDGTTNSSVTTNTNATVLAAHAFRVHGPLIRAQQ